MLPLWRTDPPDHAGGAVDVLLPSLPETLGTSVHGLEDRPLEVAGLRDREDLRVVQGLTHDIAECHAATTVGSGVLDDPALVSKVVRHADEAQALLAEGANAQTLLRRLIDSGATIEKFEMVEPSLNDIFITKVTEHR